MSEVELSGYVSADEFRAACALFPSGVTVVTRRLNDGRPYGMTVSSFTSVSLRPPLVLVCISNLDIFVKHLPPHLPIAVNVLSEDQPDIANQFADPNEADRFRNIEWLEGWETLPLLKGVVATFACSLQQTVEAGDHVVLIAGVHEIFQHEGRSLIWCESKYHCLPAPPDRFRL